jgi:replicative DNA helicase
MIDSTMEYRLLASFLDNPEYIFKVQDNLFTDNRIPLFRAIREAYLKYGEVTHEGVGLFYGSSVPGEIDAARGSKPEPLVDRLKILLKKRQLADISNRLNLLLAQQNPSVDAIQEALHYDVINDADSSITTGVAEFISDFQQKRSGKYRFISSGLRILDFIMGGEWNRKALTLIIAKPGTGKTALICSSMLQMAMNGHPVFFASLEMPKDRIVSRLVAGITEINNRDIRSGAVEEDRIADIDRAVEMLQKLPIYIVDRRGMSVQDVVNQIRIHKNAYGIDAFFVDYLQIVSRDENNDAQSLGGVTQKLRDAAVDLDVAGILLAQQNKGYEGLDSIYGSSKVSQICDIVFEVTANDSDKDNDDLRIMNLDFHKQREGPLGSFAIRYQPKFVKFLD